MASNQRRTMKLQTPRNPTFNLWSDLVPEDKTSPNFDFRMPTNDPIDLIEVSVSGLQLVIDMGDEFGFNADAIATMQSDVDWAKRRQVEYITFCYF